MRRDKHNFSGWILQNNRLSGEKSMKEKKSQDNTEKYEI